MKNKKGLLPKETLGLIIAVICIMFLVYFLTSLYFANKGDKDLELAEASLEHLIESIDSGYTEVEIYNPVGGILRVEKNWFILSWPFEEVIPNSCSNVGWENCICICIGGLNKNSEKFAERCNEKGTCLESDFVVEDGKLNRISIKDPPLILTINYLDNKITKITKEET